MSDSAQDFRLYMVGPMGSGKSTVGRHLAGLLRCPFIDSDAEIVARTGADIPWIFDVEGEAGFRRRESRGAPRPRSTPAGSDRNRRWRGR